MSSVHIRQTIDSLLAFLEPLLGFANCHMVDFYTQNSYKKFVSPEIQNEIEQIGYENTIKRIFLNEFDATPHLKQFVEDSSKFTLKNCHVCLNLDSFTQKLQSWGCDTLDTFKLEIFMNAKKSHEVEILSAVAAALFRVSQASHVVDLGDGKGYLSSMLALQHQIPVVGIDASNTNTCGAIKRATKLSKVWNGIPKAPHKSLPKKTENFASPHVELYKQVTRFVDERFDLLGLVRDVFPNVSHLGLVGLHTCGDLAASSLKIFSRNEAVKSVCNVGCCYHLLDESGFPLSRFLTDRGFVLGRSARMIANQSVERVLQEGELPNITIFYRAILQVLLEEFCTDLPTKHVGKFRKVPVNFLDYVRLALKRIDVTLDLTDNEVGAIFSRYEKRLNELNVFYLLRCKLSPVVESLILLDRLLFLQEQGFENSFLVQFFDPVVSPRCYGIVAVKNAL
ncbi:probable methyltransferase-like protein 25 [Tribolium castaneum]|uniref:probable methyltransferase-like protein 25 n=1 Tax=Tribolium castaneum TaxID=7070 RepID=UPI0001757EE9|nr:PREDICTED: methyltransferase-like protein 25 [Tribolium castaneum]|eukprot:XP_001809803.1 PREDICTED: methyltransferase-like protein 25 [Tribolium castaneum]